MDTIMDFFIDKIFMFSIGLLLVLTILIGIGVIYSCTASQAVEGKAVYINSLQKEGIIRGREVKFLGIGVEKFKVRYEDVINHYNEAWFYPEELTPIQK